MEEENDDSCCSCAKICSCEPKDRKQAVNDMDSLTSWTDDIPICRRSGVGTAPNEVYRKNGRRTEMHPMEDRHFHFR